MFVTAALDRAAAAWTIVVARASPTLCLAILIAVIATVVYRAWWSLAFVAFASSIAVMDQRRARAAEVLGMALALGAPVALGVASLILMSVSQLAPFPCGSALCPTGPQVFSAGIIVGIAAAVVLGAAARHLWRHRRGQSLLPAVSFLLLGLFVVQLILGVTWANALVEIGAPAAAAGVLPLVLDRPRPLMAALIPQVADLGTFGLVWQAGQGERNPVAGLVLEALFTRADGYWRWEAPVVTGLLLIVAKLVLIGFLMRASPHLGRYQQPVLFVAAATGVVGAVSNVISSLRFG